MDKQLKDGQEALRRAKKPILEINAVSDPDAGSRVPEGKLQNDGLDHQGEGPRDHKYRFRTDNPVREAVEIGGIVRKAADAQGVFTDAMEHANSGAPNCKE
jgi:hypothetical protein